MKLRVNFVSGFALLGLLAGRLAAGAESNAAPVQGLTQDLRQQAMVYEQQGEKLQAAATYEQTIAADPAKRMALGNRLVRLYAEAGVTNKALAWAQQMMKTNPDPQAYLAGVQALLKNYAAAREILEKELAGAPEPRRKLALSWQLADVHEKAGRPDEAGKVLQAAAENAKGTPNEAAARQALERFRVKQATQRAAAAGGARPPPAPGTVVSEP